MPSCLARCAASSGSLPSVRLPSESRITAAGARLPSLPRRAARRSSAASSASPVAVPPSALQAVERGLDRRAVERRLDDRVGLRREADEADQQLVRARGRGSVLAADCAAASRDGSTSVGRHRARLVGDEHDRRLLDRHRHVACGLAKATASVAAAAASSAAGRTRRSRGWRQRRRTPPSPGSAPRSGAAGGARPRRRRPRAGARAARAGRWGRRGSSQHPRELAQPVVVGGQGHVVRAGAADRRGDAGAALGLGGREGGADARRGGVGLDGVGRSPGRRARAGRRRAARPRAGR